MWNRDVDDRSIEPSKPYLDWIQLLFEFLLHLFTNLLRDDVLPRTLGGIVRAPRGVHLHGAAHAARHVPAVAEPLAEGVEAAHRAHGGHPAQPVRAAPDAQVLAVRVSQRERVAEDGAADREGRNSPFCPLQEKLHTVVFRGVRHISEAP